MSGLRIELQHFAYPDTAATVLQDIDIEAAPGEFVAILGPSGCGKTSLLNLLAGLNTVYTGQLTWQDEALGSRPDGLRIGCMFQEPRLMPWLTVADNIDLVLQDHADADARVERLLHAVGLAGQSAAFPNKLSGGMRRRVALARAFAIEPELLLMDEPFISLDAPTANRLRELLLELWQGSDATVVLVTHDLREAVALADRLIFLSPQPATVLLETRIELDRPRGGEDPAVSDFCRSLLDTYPGLLEGLYEKPRDE